MEKNTILAIVLSVAVITGFAIFQAKTSAQNIPQNTVSEQIITNSPETSVQELDSSSESEPGTQSETAPSTQETEINEAFPQQEELVTITTDTLSVDISNAGGDIVAFKLLAHKEGESNVDMIFTGDEPAHAFTIAFGGREAKPVSSFFAVNKISDYSYEFYRDFISDGKKFRLSKKYTFSKDEYMFELDVTVDGGAVIPDLKFAGDDNFQTAYTLGFGPQIGPPFDQLDERYDYRHYVTYINGKQKQEKVSDNKPAVISAQFSWGAIVGKYFTLIAVPRAVPSELVFSTLPAEAGLPSTSRMFLERSLLNASKVTDTYRFYMGPKTQKELARYDNNNNIWGLAEMRMEKVANASGFWGVLNPLEQGLKWLLNLFHSLIPNYGIAIILVTFLVKLILFPLTKKSSEGTIRMQSIAPKIKELQEKYKTNPQKLNLEMAALYKKEGYNPLSGCLPMLIQIPIFLAMYNLFNNHFELRGAMFISGWIPNLAVPESILNFAPHTVPILGWTDLRLLPFIYVASQLLYGKVTQTPDQTGNKQMKFMLYAMPIIFFFVLYNMPSGLLIYWIMSNVLTLVQQLIINRIMAPKRAAIAAAAAASEQEKKIVPPHQKKKKK
ncbi:MAG: membrane protein insertase YidC [Spirochaetaceae bacterium]|jgi:YidC/Oxa1 family membrane protein insertase|nr:membrane protein insertase YidC [Spirochaetaceae bacterium]